MQAQHIYIRMLLNDESDHMQIKMKGEQLAEDMRQFSNEKRTKVEGSFFFFVCY